jgi:IPT/TIG domain
VRSNRRVLVGACGLALAVLALMPALVRAAGVATVSSLVPNEFGSAGGTEFTIHGAEFEPPPEVRLGTVVMKFTSGILTKGTCKGKSATELECIAPFHEHGKVHTTATNPAGTSAQTTADEVTSWPEVYRSEVKWARARPTPGTQQPLPLSLRRRSQLRGRAAMRLDKRLGKRGSAAQARQPGRHRLRRRDEAGTLTVSKRK